MSGVIETKIEGLKDFREALQSIPTKLRRRALLNALRAGGRVVRDAARANAPVLSLDSQLRAPYRKPGTLRGAISVRASKQAKKDGNVGVFINVKPLPGAKYRTVKSTGVFGGKTKRRVLVRASQRSAKNPNDPFYWRFVNFDHKARNGRVIPGAHFLERGGDALGEALKVFEQTLGPQIQKLNTNPKDPL